MARTKGAKDKRIRKKPAAKAAKAQQTGPITGGSGSTPQREPVTERPPLPPDDFKSAIAAELQACNAGSGSDQPGQQPAPPQASPQAAPAFDPTTLTIEGLAAAWQVPFWVLAWALKILRVIPDPEPVVAVGKRRAKDLAKPSYAIYEHYTRQYLGLSPENSVHVAAGVTALDAVGIVPEIVEACIKSRRSAVRIVATEGQAPAAPVAGTGT